VSSGRVAAIDIGTNTTLLLIAEARDGRLVAVDDRATITRLGEGVDRSGQLAEAAVERTLTCLRGYAERIAAAGCARVAAVGTSAMRDAQGGARFRERAREILGVEPEVVSGAREAELTFAGAIGDRPSGELAVFDIGGGSTEIITGHKAVDGAAQVGASASLDIGAVRLSERHIRSDPPAAHELEAIVADIERALDAAPPLGERALVGVAGTMTTLAALVRDVDHLGATVHGVRLTRDDIAAAVDRLGRATIAERRVMRGVEPARADVIVGGALIARAIVARSRGEVVVSDRGVRWGLADVLVSGA
jgi:exopolyphosphatase / guanosine-5'-triphosphate,3'-diphosphate pyrophosphatase